MTTALVIAGVIVVLLLMIVPAAIKVVPEWERGVILRLGRFIGLRGPGLVVLIPYVEIMRRMDLRIVTMDVPSQDCITKDNVTVGVNAVVYFRVISAEEAVLKVQDHIRATHQISQTTLRSVIGQYELDDLLSRREMLNLKLQQIIDEQTSPWGIKVSVVEVKDVSLPDTMKRSMAAQAEAERERRAKIVHAEGEFQAAERLVDAAHKISAEPVALQLRYLQALTEIARDHNSTIIFPLPIDLLSGFLQGRGLGAPSSGGEKSKS